ncbi:MAG: AAA family ATPase [Candidatus Dependentiae bacterium]|nr:AAA family ATPase [Candidatus Dependentiae bacterium]
METPPAFYGRLSICAACLVMLSSIGTAELRAQETWSESTDGFVLSGGDDSDGNETAGSEENNLLETHSAFTATSLEIATMIQHLSQLTENDRTVGKDRERVEQVIEWLNTLQEQNSLIRHSPAMPLDPRKLSRSLNAQAYLMRTLREAINNGFRHLPDIAPLLDEALNEETRSIPGSDELSELSNRNVKSLERLTQAVEDCGLSSFNKFYGKISPVIPWMLGAGLLSAGGLGGWWFYRHITTISPDHQSLISEGLREGERGIVSGLAQSLFFGTVAAIPHIYRWVSQKYDVVDSYLRGNAFKPDMTQEVVDDLTLADHRFDHLRDKLVPIDLIIKYIKNPEKFSLAGIKNYRAILLVGEPGSGKSFLARAIAGQLQKTVGHGVMINVDIEHYIEKGGIKKIFEEAKRRSGCVVIFIDEIHLFGVQAEKNVQGLQELLTCLDELDRETDQQKQIFIIGATNRPDLIEDPLKRQGRFGTTIELTKPLFADRVQILTTLCKKSAIDPEELQVERIARLSAGRTISDIDSMFSQACFFAKSENTPVTFEHIYRALNVKIRKLSDTVNLRPDEIRIVSCHLAGIACAVLELKSPQQLDMITLHEEQKKITARYDIIAKIKNDEEKFFIPDPGVAYLYEDAELINNIGQTDQFAPVKILLAGLVAQRIVCGSETSYHAKDRQKAFDTAVKILSGGIDLKKLARKEREEILGKASAAIRTCEAEVETVLTEHKANIERIAKALAKQKMLRVEEIRTILAEQN